MKQRWLKRVYGRTSWYTHSKHSISFLYPSCLPTYLRNIRIASTTYLLGSEDAGSGPVIW
ncbi:predicted protein [Botrytis cinerea T4]|uniref:Uncharacterized protein n=1 Tax=Botryotinia fuckeliana (strain T4) TaxID=999810 RepID=G2Y145_BOTF4|nr:predicted protein [Botrytis cinerea T4]